MVACDGATGDSHGVLAEKPHLCGDEGRRTRSEQAHGAHLTGRRPGHEVELVESVVVEDRDAGAGGELAEDVALLAREPYGHPAAGELRRVAFYHAASGGDVELVAERLEVAGELEGGAQLAVAVVHSGDGEDTADSAAARGAPDGELLAADLVARALDDEGAAVEELLRGGARRASGCEDGEDCGGPERRVQRLTLEGALRSRRARGCERAP